MYNEREDVMAGKKELTAWREEYLRRLEQCGMELCEKEMPDLKEEDFARFELTGNRLVYEDAYFARRKYLTVFGCLAIFADKDKSRYLKKLEEIILQICEEECWALPAHVNRKENENWRIYVDLFAAETAAALSEVSHYLQQELSPRMHALICENVMHRVIRPYLAKRPYDTWEQSDMNWNAVCNGGIGIAACYLLGHENEICKVITDRVKENLKYYIDGFGDDGTCYEGLSYFTYGLYFYVGFWDVCGSRIKEASDWATSEKCQRIAEFQQKCYFPSGMTLSFSDGSSHDKYRMGLTCKLASVYDTVSIPSMSAAADLDSDPCFRFHMILRDLKWTEEYLRAESKEADRHFETVKKCIVFPEAQWGICHGKSGGGMACKGGHNDEPHNHNDIGSFLYMIGDDMVLPDLGAGEYTKQYFSQGRYEILCNHSLGHNVPIVDGLGQKEGKEYCCSGFQCDGEWNFRFRAETAYDNPELEKWIRSLHYDSDTECLTVEDVFGVSGCVVEENLVTQYEPMVEGNQILLRTDNADCRIVVEQSDVIINIKKEVHSNHEGKVEDVFRMIWKVTDSEDVGEKLCRFRIEKI